MLPLILALLSGGPPVADTVVVSRVVVAPNEVLTTTTAGQGPAIILVPGFMGGGFGFRELVPRFAAAGYKVVVIEPLGIGRSSRPKGADYSLTAQTARLDRAMELLGISHALVIGHSMGATLGLRLACGSPARVRGVLAIEGGVNENAGTGGLRRLVRLGPLASLLMNPATARSEVGKSLKEHSFDASWVTPAVIDGYSAYLTRDSHGSLDLIRAMVKAPEPTSTESALNHCVVPTVLLLGGESRPEGKPVDTAGILSGWLTRMSVDTLASVGMYIHEEQPDQVVGALEKLDRATRGI